MLLDSGADVSLVPKRATQQLALPEEPAARVEVLGFDGRSSTADAFELEMTFAGKVFRGRFLVLDEECGILGRNILNSFSILHDGPLLTWEAR